MSVETWEPASPVRLTSQVVSEFLAAATQLSEPEFALSAESVGRLAAYARQSPTADWTAAAEDLQEMELISLIRLFTLGEARFAAWESGSKAPVIPLAGVLRTRDAYPADLTKWIKNNTENRFLPYGSLLDRL